MLTFLVVGSGRCGTGYISQVLTYMGIPCGHRWVHHPGPRRYPHVEIVGDASALAAPWARGFNGLVLHQVREPLKVIGSYLGTGLFRDHKGHGAVGEYLSEHFMFTGQEVLDAMRFYVEWNDRCERGDRYTRYRVEDVDEELLRRLADQIGVEVEGTAIERALAKVPRDFNANYERRTVTWADFPECSFKDDLVRMADRYGYPSSDARAGRANAA